MAEQIISARIVLKSLKKLACIFALAGLSQVAFGASASLPGRPRELTSIDFEKEWLSTSDAKFPTSAFRAFPKDTQDYLRESPDVSLIFLFVDLNWDGTNEIIVADPSASGSGGQAYFALRRIGKKWKLIGEFQGGFVLSMRDDLVDYKDDFYRITTYYRSGDTYQNTYDYKNGRYHGTGQVMIPQVITDSCWWGSFWSRLNGYAEPTGRMGKCESNSPKIDHRRETNSRKK